MASSVSASLLTRRCQMISYAQNFEDVMLRRVFRDRKDGFYIDVGAMDPTIDSVSKHFYDEGWSGINVEPNPYFYGKLLAERPRDINLNLALGDREELREFHVFERIGNSTFDLLSRDRYVEEGHEPTPTRVKVTTLSALCRDFVRSPIDFLKIDCEGWEKQVIRGADWQRFHPTVVVVEATQPGTSIPAWSEWEPYLLEAGDYEMVYFDGLNRFYLWRQFRELRSCFEIPPNVFDDFKLYLTLAADRRAQELEPDRNRLAARIEEIQSALRSSESSLRALCTQNEENLRRIAELEPLRSDLSAAEAELRKITSELATMTRDKEDLEQRLLSAKLWVGQLSQELAAIKSTAGMKFLQGL